MSISRMLDLLRRGGRVHPGAQVLRKKTDICINKMFRNNSDELMKSECKFEVQFGLLVLLFSTVNHLGLRLFY